MSLLCEVASVSNEEVLMASSWCVGCGWSEGMVRRVQGRLVGLRIVVRVRI